MKARFSPQVIGELRHRVILHNEHLPDALRKAEPMKLGVLKGLYKRWYGGRDPHQHALRKIDEHLATLVKAQPPFDPSQHPRNNTGQFSGQKGFYEDVAQPAQHRALADENAGYEASQTQVIPETRYSVFGPKIAGAAGVATGAVYGGITGATVGRHGTPLDRVQARVTESLGRHVGGIAGFASAVPVRVAATATRDVVGRVNAAAHTTIPRPHPDAGKALTRKAAAAGARLGGAVGRGASRAQTFAFSAPPRVMRAAVERNLVGHPRAKLAGRVAGGVTGGLISAAVLGPGMYHLATTLGPYLDAAFPRRVRKLAGPWFDDADVLAKQHELTHDELAKINLGATLRGLGQATRSLGGSAARIIRTLRPSIASHTSGSLAAPGAPAAARANIGHEAASSTFARANDQPKPLPGVFNVRPQRVARGGVVASHAAALGTLGAGTGAIAGAAGVGAHDYLFANKHPRDPHGRFATKAKSAKIGAVVGGSVGLGFGLVAGLVAARRGHGQQLSAALARLGEAVKPMHQAAETTARNDHAKAFLEAPANRTRLPENTFGADETITHTQVAAGLRQKARDAWNATHGRALRLGPVDWYKHQIDTAFDQEAFRTLHGQLDPLGKPTPLRDKITGHAFKASTADKLFDRLDVDALNPNQKVIWNNLATLRQNKIGELEGLYAGRVDATKAIRSEIKARKEEGLRIDEKLANVPRALDELEATDPSYQSVLKFSRDHIGHHIKARSRDDAMNEAKVAVNEWMGKQEARGKVLQDEIDDLETKLKAADSKTAQDVDATEQMAVQNPFATKQKGNKQPAYFRSMPDPKVEVERVATEAARDFEQASNRVALAAKTHLNSLIGAQQAALEARIPKSGFLGELFNDVAPEFTAHLQRGIYDVNALWAGNRASAKGWQKAFYDWANQHKNWQGAQASAKKAAGFARSRSRRTGAFLLNHWKAVSGVVGIANGIGAIDLASGPGRPKFRVHPKHWKLPKNIQLETEWPNPISRPNEAIFGVSYRDKDNQQRFLHGIHIRSASGEHTLVPFGASVEGVKNQVRNFGQNQQGNNQNRGGNQGQRVPPVTVSNPDAVTATIQKLNEGGYIMPAGPPGAMFLQRDGGDGGADEGQVSNAIWNQYLGNVARVPRTQSISDPGKYWPMLRAIFDAPNAQIMDNAKRAQLLVGSAGKRGLFGDPDGAFKPPANADKNAVHRALETQMKVLAPQLHRPDDYINLKMALWTVGTHYELPRLGELMAELGKAYTKANSAQPPFRHPPGHTSSANVGGTAGGGDRSQELFDIVSGMSPEAISPSFHLLRTDNKTAAETAQDVFRDRLRYLATHQPNHPDPQKDAFDSVLRLVKGMGKSAPDGGLRKFLSWTDSKPPRVKSRPIAGAASPATPRLPGTAPASLAPPAVGRTASKGGIQGAAGGRGASSNTATRLDASHQLSQAGSYGLSQTAWEGANALATRLLPGGGALGATTRFVAPAVASATGLTLGTGLGARSGHALGDSTVRSRMAPGSDNEALVRPLVGTSAQLGTMHATTVASKVGLKAMPGVLGREALSAPAAIGRKVVAAPGAIGRGIAGAARGVAARLGGSATRVAATRAGEGIAGAAGRAAATGTFEAIGARIGGGVGTVAGGVAGGVADPLGGEVAGGLGGKVLGTALGAGAGWLADEGVGLLYRHLGHYGKHVPKIAAKTLGHHA